MQRQEAHEAEAVPIIVKKCDWQKLPFAKLQGLPEGAKPVTKWDDRAEAWTSVATGIRTVVEKMVERKKAAVVARSAEEFIREVKIPTLSQNAREGWGNRAAVQARITRRRSLPEKSWRASNSTGQYSVLSTPVLSNSVTVRNFAVDAGF